MKHITLTLLIFILHTGLTYGAFARNKISAQDSPSQAATGYPRRLAWASDEDLLDRESLEARLPWHKIFKFPNQTRKILKDILKVTCLSARNKPTIYSESFRRSLDIKVPVTILIDELITCAAINTSDDLTLFCNNLHILLTEEQQDRYTKRLQELNAPEAALFSVSQRFRFDVQDVESFIAQGARVNAQNPEGWTMLMRAARRQCIESATFLLQQSGIDVNAQNDKGDTALMWATCKGSKEFVQLLLNNPELDINAQDKNHRTALYWAKVCDHKAIEKLLLDDPRIQQNNCGCILL